MDKQKIFPIQQDPACLLKWAWSTVFLNIGKSNSCHRVKSENIPLDDFDSFHNLPGKILERESMLQGEWPENSCQYCRKIEESGGSSDRNLQLEKLADPNLVPPELRKDPTSTSVTPTMLEVYFHNICNMKCMYCRPDQSSQWQQELKKFGPMKTLTMPNIPISEKDVYEKRLSALWAWMERNSDVLRRYHILGGEPFLMDETEASLDFWESHPNPDLIFSMFSNLNIDVERFERLFEKMQRLVDNGCVWKFQITASLDCWFPEVEYVRFGLDGELFRRNFEKLVEMPWISLSVNSAVTSLTIKAMPDFLEYLDKCDRRRAAIGADPIDRSYNLVSDPRHKDRAILIGGNTYDKDFDKIIEILEKSLIHRPEEIEHIKSLKHMISSYPLNHNGISNLKEHLDELDSRRNTNWRLVFPWLDQLPTSSA